MYSIGNGITSRANVLWLGLALALTSGTQLRFGESPIGPGECLLVAWLFCTALSVLLQKRIALEESGILIVGFWGGVFVLLMGGWLVGLFSGRWGDTQSFHNLFAYGICAVSALIFLIRTDHKSRIVPIIKAYSWFVVAGLGGLLLISLTTGQLSIIGVDMWFGDVRFVGWAKNPNQTALAIGPVFFVGLFFFTHAESRWQIFLATLMVFLSFVIGVFTRSDALFVAWAFSAVVFIAVHMLGKPGTKVFSPNVLTSYASIGALCLLVAPVWLPALVTAVTDMMAERGQASLRFTIWGHGVEVITSSPLVGYGPGTFSGIYSAFGGLESHNTYIDLMTNSGIPSGILFSGLICIAFFHSVKRRHAALAGCVTFLSVFSVFHYTIRHPLFWFMVLFVLLGARYLDRAANGKGNLMAFAGRRLTPSAG